MVLCWKGGLVACKVHLRALLNDERVVVHVGIAA